MMRGRRQTAAAFALLIAAFVLLVAINAGIGSLAIAPGDVLRVNLGSGTSPCVLTPEDGGDSFLYMILPVRLRAGD